MTDIESAEREKPDAKPETMTNPRRPKIPEIRQSCERSWEIVIEKVGDLQQLFGGSSDELGRLLIHQCYASMGNNSVTMDTQGHVALLVAEIEPRDAVEAMLPTQMAMTHMAIVRHSAKLADAEYLETVALHERILTKLSRTFTTQMEALRKHRNGGKQTVTVQHVNVEDGGQAIVGHVATGGGNS